MMRFTLRILLGLALAAIFFIAGALTAGMRHWFQPLVTVNVINESGQHIKSLRIVHSSLGGKGTIETASLRPGEERTIRFFLAGEGSYSIEASLEDGRVLKGGEGYVEAGYASRQVVSKTGVITYATAGPYAVPL